MNSSNNYSFLEAQGSLVRRPKVIRSKDKMPTAFFTLLEERDIGKDDPVKVYHEFQTFGDGLADLLDGYESGQALTVRGVPRYEGFRPEGEEYDKYAVRFIVEEPSDIAVPKGAELLRREDEDQRPGARGGQRVAGGQNGSGRDSGGRDSGGRDANRSGGQSRSGGNGGGKGGSSGASRNRR